MFHLLLSLLLIILQVSVPSGEAAEGRIYENQSSVCQLHIDPGPCRMVIPRFYFEERTKECRTFIYSGCGGNGNNFDFYEECVTLCHTPR